jgi:cobaltochelatase CobN
VKTGKLSRNDADEIASGRIYGPREGGYGTGILPALEDSTWKEESDLADIYERSMSHLYAGNVHGSAQIDQFRISIGSVALVSQVRDASDIDIIDLDHYFEFFGGLAKTVEISSGKKPVLLISDTSSELIRTEEIESMIARGVRTRLLNPKWIDGMLAHDYHGAQSIGERVHNILGLASTTNAVGNWVWSSIAERYIFDDGLLQRMKENNQFATKHLMDRLFEAAQRGYWSPTNEEYENLLSAYLKIEGDIEAGAE